MATSSRGRVDRRLAGAIVQFGSFVVILGIPDGLVGVLWPTMRRSLHRPLADLGELVLVGTALYLVGGLVGDRIQRAIGLRATLLWCTIVGLGSLLGWALAPSWWIILVSFCVLGLVKGVLDAVLNAVAAVDGGVRRLGFLHASWAIGGTLGPVLVATLVAGGDWRAAVGVVAGAAAVLVPFAAMAPRSAVRTGDSLPQPVSEGGSPARRPNTHRPQWAGLVATTLAFMAYTAAEAGPVSWGATYLISDRHLGTTAAAVSMAAFWAALTLGRLGLAVPHPWHPSRILEVSCLLFMAGMALFWLLPGSLAVIGLPIAGLGSATIFPLYMALTPDRLGEEVTGRAVGYSIAGAAAGGPAAVAVFGILAAHFGTGVLAPCLFGAAVVMYLAHRLLALVVRDTSPPDLSPSAP
ncbi:MAG: MFS transporter [Acidimicrobiales bacterium]